MPVRVELQLMGDPERLPLKHIRPGEEPYELHDYTAGPGMVIAALCREKNRCGEIYHIPGEQLDAFPDAEGVPEELLTDDNLHTVIPPGSSYERSVVIVEDAKDGVDVDVARFIFTHFK